MSNYSEWNKTTAFPFQIVSILRIETPNTPETLMYVDCRSKHMIAECGVSNIIIPEKVPQNPSVAPWLVVVAPSVYEHA